MSSRELSVCPAMENLLAIWVGELRKNDCFVTGDSIKDKAMNIHRNIHPFWPMPES